MHTDSVTISQIIELVLHIFWLVQQEVLPYFTYTYVYENKECDSFNDHNKIITFLIARTPTSEITFKDMVDFANEQNARKLIK